MSRQFARAFVVFLFATSAIITAQVAGRLSGTVVDPSGAPVPNASVKLMLADGATPVGASTSNVAGIFLFPSLRPETYDVVFEANGFRKNAVRGVKVTAAQETPLGAVKLELGAVTETIEVTGSTQAVQTSNAEISSTVTNEQLRKLPTMDRSPMALLLTQAGTTTNNRAPSTVNGLRVSFVNVTLDGINIQDNFIRDNGLDFQPNRLLLDQVAEVNVGIANNNLSQGGGAAQINFVTPSGTNQYHGGVLWNNRNNAFAANSWFRNRDKVARPFLNQNQFGASLGGFVVKDKLFFYANYEGTRLRQQSAANRTILSADARNGIFTYVASGQTRKVNVLQAAGLTIDPAAKALIDAVPGADKINNFRVGDSSEALLRNTAGYSFNIRDNLDRDNITGKVDYYLNSKNNFSGTYTWNHNNDDRTDVANDYSSAPKVQIDSAPTFLSLTWRWTPTATTTNELRGGFNRSRVPFKSTESFPKAIAAGLLFSNPVNTFRDQGRQTNTYNLQDNTTTVKGKHTIQYGFLYQKVNADPYNDAGITPTYTLGISVNNPNGLNSNQLPGISAQDLTAANNLLANVAGLVSAYTQTFNVTSRNSGFVSGATDLRRLTQDNWSLYAQDAWKLNRKLSLILGVRYEYHTRLDEADALYLLPQGLTSANARSLLLSNATYDFAGSAVGRPWYNPDRNNFAPNIGFAYDVFGNGRTAIRGGYSVNFVNDNNVPGLRNSLNTNAGLQTTVTASGLVSRLSNPTPVPVPAFKVPRTAADNYAVNSQSAQAAVEPNLRTPYVQQYSVGIQHNIKETIIELRYVGNHAVKQFRAFDVNQVNIGIPGYLDDFRRAYNNGILAQSAGRGFDPAYNSAIAGSQQTPFFNALPSGGLLGNATIRSQIQTQQPGELATTYQVNRLNGNINFFANPYGLGMNLFSNYSHSSYNGLQFDVRRRLRSGVQLQANYTYGKVLSDTSGDSQTRFDAFLDANNGKIERSRAIFDVTHVIRANGVYELPLGKGHNWNPSNPVLNRIVSGWNISAIMTRQSGTPFSVLSGRGTFNRAARSTATNTANTALNKSQLDNVIGYRMTGNGPYIVDLGAIGPDGRAVAADGAANFSGQVFSQPTAGNIGALQRRYFSGPWNFALDFSAQKVTNITEKQTLEFRIDSTNILNHPTFDVGGDYTVTSTTFGRLTSAGFSDPRLIQFALKYRF